MPSKTFVIFKVSAKEPQKTKELMNSLKSLKNGEVRDVKAEPIGYGIEVVKVGVLFDEKDQEGIEKTLNEIRANKLVEGAEVDGMTLV